MKVTINKIRVELQAVAEAHEMINSFFWGDFHRSWNEESLTYPLVCGYVASGGSLSKNLTNVPLTIVVADKVFKDYSSLNDTESDTLQVCRHIFNTLNMSPRWNALIRVNSASVEKFIDRGSDEIAGHILNMNVDIKDSYSICNLPMGDYDFESTAENGCAGVLIVNSDGTFNFTAPSGSIVDLPDTPVTVRNVSGDEVGSGDVPSVTGGIVTVPDCPVSGDGTAVLKDTDGNVLSTTNVAPETTVDIIAPDADYEIRKSNNAILYQGSIPSGGALVQNIQDSMVRVRKSDNQLIAEVDVRAESVENYNVADSTAVLKDSAGTIISTTSIKATESEDITAPDTTIQVNGVTEGTHVAGSTIDLQLTDGVNPVTPDSVTKVGDNYEVVVPVGGGLDPDAEAFLTAASITDATITSAIDTLVTELKTNNLWVKFHAIYPFVGGTATTHKFNLKDPRDLNEAYRLTFFGGITHSATGVDPNGTTGYAETYINPTSYGTSDIHLSFYSRENTSAGTDRVDIGTVTGATNRFWLSAGLSNNNSPTSGLGVTLAATTGAADGFFVACLTGGTVINNSNTLYKNGSSIATSTSTMQVTNQNTIHLFKWNGIAGGFSNRECAFASIGHGMTAGQVATFNTLVQAFNTTLFRNV